MRRTEEELRQDNERQMIALEAQSRRQLWTIGVIMACIITQFIWLIILATGWTAPFHWNLLASVSVVFWPLWVTPVVIVLGFQYSAREKARFLGPYLGTLPFTFIVAAFVWSAFREAWTLWVP
jgi:hypothetical protein